MWTTAKHIARHGLISFIRNGLISLAAVLVMTITLSTIATTLLSGAALSALLSRQLRGQPATAAISMCGSGVTACHTLLALEIAGLPGARLYPGSWSEWSRDEGRPVAVGP